MPEPFSNLPVGVTAELDQRMAENAATARVFAAFHQALKAEGLPGKLAATLTEMYAGFVYEQTLHLNGCHDHED